MLSILSSILIGCSPSETPESDTEDGWIDIRGNTQGTTYQVILFDRDKTVGKAELDSILYDFDMALSTYIDSSIISYINNTDTAVFEDQHGYLINCLRKSLKVYDKTGGAFDPSVYPLVKAWGFFGDSLQTPSDNELEEILNSVGLNESNFLFSEKTEENSNLFIRKKSDFKLDFNAIAQGYAVDVLADHIDDHGISNYYIEIGGEIIVKGENRDLVNWRLGIDVPKFEGQREIENVVNLTDKAIATSGNYRKYYVKDGVKYAHTINPQTGRPVQHSLLSATVIAETCAEADAYATAFMVMGVDASLQFVKDHPELDLDIYLLYDDGSGTIQRAMSDGFDKYLQ